MATYMVRSSCIVPALRRPLSTSSYPSTARAALVGRDAVVVCSCATASECRLGSFGDTEGCWACLALPSPSARKWTASEGFRNCEGNSASESSEGGSSWDGSSSLAAGIEAGRASALRGADSASSSVLSVSPVSVNRRTRPPRRELASTHSLPDR